MSIFDKACPQCMGVSPAYAPRCACGHVFDSGSEEDRTLTPEQVAQQEVLFEEYLAARFIQAAEAAKVARRAAELAPQDARRATEAVRAQHAATLAEAELEAQQARARSAADAAGIDRAALSRTRAETALLPPVVNGFLAGAWQPLRSVAAGKRTAFHPRAASARGRNARAARARAWKRALTKTVIGAAKTTTIVAKAAKTVVGAAARGATRAVKATQEKRRRSRLPAAAGAKSASPDPSPPAGPPSTTGTGARTPPARSRLVSDRPVAAAVPQDAAGISAAPGARRDQAGALLPALPSRPKQGVVPSPRFRKAQAQKIAAAVAAGRRFDAGSATCECPLCSAELPSTATRCRCGWRSAAAQRDMPALAGDEPSTSSVVVVQQCPQCTAALSTGVARCKCGWKVPAGASELLPVSLTADERQALSLGLELLPPTR